MNHPRKLTIVGGGLAGLTLGIALRQGGIPVRVVESGRYPRHRVCGEFLSGRGLGVLERLGLTQPLLGAGGRWASTIRLAAPGQSRKPERLPAPALCLSRFQFDSVLADQFLESGGDLQVGIRHPEGSSVAEGTIYAGGRERFQRSQGWRLFGLKAHVRGARLNADLELHRVPSGYVGLCDVEEGLTNVCGLFWSRYPVPGLMRQWSQWLCGAPGSPLACCMQDAEFVPDSFCSVAGLGWRHSLDGPDSRRAGYCRIGDAFAFIPPFTGNGMSLALESAELAAGPLAAYSRGCLDWSAATHAVRTVLTRRFRGRLRRALVVQNLMQGSWPNRVTDAVILRVPGLWQSLFRSTR